MAWPEKVGISVACLIVAVFVYGLLILLNSTASVAPFELQDWTRFGFGLIKTELFVALPVWLVARLFDLIIGGPARRKAKKTQPEARPL